MGKRTKENERRKKVTGCINSTVYLKWASAM